MFSLHRAICKESVPNLLSSWADRTELVMVRARNRREVMNRVMGSIFYFMSIKDRAKRFAPGLGRQN